MGICTTVEMQGQEKQSYEVKELKSTVEKIQVLQGNSEGVRQRRLRSGFPCADRVQCRYSRYLKQRCLTKQKISLDQKPVLLM